MDTIAHVNIRLMCSSGQYNDRSGMKYGVISLRLCLYFGHDSTMKGNMSQQNSLKKMSILQLKTGHNWDLQRPLVDFYVDSAIIW